jgi:hypothetical protein
MAFWKLAYSRKWVDAEQLKIVVGKEITEAEYAEITGTEYVA